MTDRIFVPVASAPFWRFVQGTKKFEVRSGKSPVARKVLRSVPGTPVLLRRGYSTKDELNLRLGRVYRASNWNALPDEAKKGADRRDEDLPLTYYDPAEEVVAFECLSDQTAEDRLRQPSRLEGGPTA